MSPGLRNRWKRLRARPVLSLAVDVSLIIAVFLAIHAWNTRSLRSGALPDLDLPALSSLTVPETRGVGVIYFFAPWCVYCKNSIDNLESLVTSGRVGWARAVALEYESLEDIREFVGDTGFTQPVLLGNRAVARQWGIRAFPTYFVINTEGEIASRSVGYSTRAGLWMRAQMAE